MKFKKYLHESQVEDAEIKIHTLIHLSENIDLLNESDDDILEGIQAALGKVGLHAKKSKGLLAYIKTFATGVGKVFLYIIKGDTKKAKEIVKTFDKDEFLDFVLKLDQGTLHLITGPLHMIEAWTGWHIWAHVKDKAAKGATISSVIHDAINNIKANIPKLFANDTSRQKKVLVTVNKLNDEIPAV